MSIISCIQNALHGSQLIPTERHKLINHTGRYEKTRVGKRHPYNLINQTSHGTCPSPCRLQWWKQIAKEKTHCWKDTVGESHPYIKLIIKFEDTQLKRHSREKSQKKGTHWLIICHMGHFSSLADCNDEKDAVISDLHHRDEREPATESQPTTFEDTYIWKVL